MPVEKALLGIAGEYLVAAELAKRNVYAQLTLGNRKRTDLLVLSDETGKMLKIEVKCKQAQEWPNCKGIYQKDSFIVFVDFKNLGEKQRPDFYILSVADWKAFVAGKERDYNLKHPERKTEINDQNVLVLLDEVKNGKSYQGSGVKPKDIEQHKERWDKIMGALTGNRQGDNKSTL